MSDERDPSTDQPEPEVNDHVFVQDLVLRDIEDRKQFGINKYGTALQTGNGRDMLRDAYEEAQDLVIYLRGMIEEDHEIVLDLQRVRRERNDLVNWAQRRAAPLQYTSTGTIHSAMHNLGSYIDLLESAVLQVKTLLAKAEEEWIEADESGESLNPFYALKDLKAVVASVPEPLE